MFSFCPAQISTPWAGSTKDHSWNQVPTADLTSRRHNDSLSRLMDLKSVFLWEMFNIIPYVQVTWQITEVSNAFSKVMFSAPEEIAKTKCSLCLSLESLLDSKDFHSWGDKKNSHGNVKFGLLNKKKQEVFSSLLCRFLILSNNFFLIFQNNFHHNVAAHLENLQIQNIIIFLFCLNKNSDKNK